MSLKLLVLLLLLYPRICFSEISIYRWDQNNVLTENGQIVQTEISARVEGLKQHEFYSSWGYSFSKEQIVFLLESRMQGKKNYRTVFENNKLSFKFDHAVNGDFLTFRVRYFVASSGEGDEYTRHEWIKIPSFAAGSRGSLKVHLPEGWVAYDSGKWLKGSGKSGLRWKGVLPSRGVSEYIGMTPDSAVFRVMNSVSVSSDAEVSSLRVSFPAYFRDSPDRVISSVVTTDPGDAKISRYSGKVHAEFSAMSNFEVQALTDTTVEVFADPVFPDEFGTGKDLFHVEGRERELLKQVIKQIKKDLFLDRSPDYRDVAKWVHSYLRYDLALSGKDLSLREILKGQRGVCSHFALLFVKIMRVLDVPAVVATGMAWDAKNKEFSGHAWAAIRPGRRWISVDPTWNIYSGQLPVSHIYMSTDSSSSSVCTWLGKQEPELQILLQTSVHPVLGKSRPFSSGI